MGGLFGGGSTTSSGGTAAQNSTIGGITSDPAGRRISSGGFVDDGAKRMPSPNDKVSAESARKKALGLRGRSGRTSTDLSGTKAYVNTFLGQSG
jgi:hypothetical protein